MRFKNTILVKGERMVCRIFDAGEDFADRYTIAFKKADGVYPYLASGPDPFHPQGFGQYGETTSFITGREMGKRISFESLPEDVQKFILQNI